MNINMKGATIALLGSLLVASASASVTFDNFMSGAESLQIVTGTGTIEGQALGTMAGGQRDVLLNLTSNPLNRNLSFDVVPGQGASFLSSGPGVVGSLSLDYDGIDNELVGDGVQTRGPGMGLNLTGESGVAFNFLFADDSVNVFVTAETYNSNGTVSSSTISINQGATNGPATATALFSAFGSPVNGGANFAKLDRLVIKFQGNNPATDFALASIATPAPEPISMATVGIGLVGLLARRRRKRN